MKPKEQFARHTAVQQRDHKISWEKKHQPLQCPQISQHKNYKTMEASKFWEEAAYVHTSYQLRMRVK